MESNRRCEQCNQTTNWVADVLFCPLHGEPVKEFPAPVCPGCGVKVKHYDWCTSCGARLRST